MNRSNTILEALITETYSFKDEHVWFNYLDDVAEKHSQEMNYVGSGDKRIYAYLDQDAQTSVGYWDSATGRGYVFKNRLYQVLHDLTRRQAQDQDHDREEEESHYS